MRKRLTKKEIILVASTTKNPTVHNKNGSQVRTQVKRTGVGCYLLKVHISDLNKTVILNG